MVSYPHLSIAQQQYLPELQQATPLPALFDDSTHKLWHCETADGAMVLKLCNNHSVKTSSFWTCMNTLFDVDLPNNLAQFSTVYEEITKLSPLVIPEYIASGALEDGQPFPAFILARFESGSMIETVKINALMIAALAEHISQMHQRTHNAWGTLLSAKLPAAQWSQRLHNTLTVLANNQTIPIPNELINDALKIVRDIEYDDFAVIMLDLRWDQFLQRNGKLSVLVDLDAFVFGPIELEFVLLEYLLDAQQAVTFAQYYSNTHSLPELSQVRKPYRLLLFMMNVLGETDIDVWMQAPTRF